MCAICLDLMANGSETTKLPCAHAFHAACVDDLRSFGINHTCPMCRADLPPGPMQLHQDAAMRYLALKKAVLKANEGTWSPESMTPDQESEAEAILSKWQEAAGGGLGPVASLAHCGIGVFLSKVRRAVAVNSDEQFPCTRSPLYRTSVSLLGGRCYPFHFTELLPLCLASSFGATERARRPRTRRLCG